jgi:hypothetical protein
MPKKPVKTEPVADTPRDRLPVRALAKIGATLAAAVTLYAAVAWIGRAAGEAVAQRPEYQVPFDAIAVSVPPGVDRETFLNEVKYLGTPPKVYSRVDVAARAILADAFAKHPWVQSAVPAADAEAPVTLVFRTPALRVITQDGPERLVDTKGVLLPVTPWPGPLPTLRTPQPSPLSPAGELWLNPHLRTALTFVNDYAAWDLTLSAGQWSFTQQNGKRYTMPARK